VPDVDCTSAEARRGMFHVKLVLQRPRRRPDDHVRLASAWSTTPGTDPHNRAATSVDHYCQWITVVSGSLLKDAEICHRRGPDATVHLSPVRDRPLPRPPDAATRDAATKVIETVRRRSGRETLVRSKAH
jgi:hypothetical protein